MDHGARPRSVDAAAPVALSAARRYVVLVTTPKRVLIIQNTPSGGPRRLETWLTDAGLDVEILKGFETTLPEQLDADGLVVLGGGYLPDADDRAPWLPATRSLVEQALREKTPVLGICLGGQLLAHVAGGVVTGEVGAPENGSTPITLRSECGGDALFDGLPQTVPGIEHHVDAITELPPEAVWLAQTDRCPYQAFRVGPVAWGLQFHPEITADRILTWDTERLAAQGFDRTQLHATAVADEPVSTPVWRTMVTRFAATISDGGARAGSSDVGERPTTVPG
ncbi:GMP synthase-like glutamine amidotransferase [Stackebrandtia endophytica]|uniref:GMP synthase-like glutamine amidotransferase n=1 Tax=Stackebrandtia endophytica TaxID=1496996 RepID=A0A543AR33_9ACTN|nr:GMP synthase-like glutamine amidotransferase [Stackebrandtia endophytica]